MKNKSTIEREMQVQPKSKQREVAESKIMIYPIIITKGKVSNI